MEEISWADKISKDEILGRVNDILDSIRKQKQ